MTANLSEPTAPLLSAVFDGCEVGMIVLESDQRIVAHTLEGSSGNIGATLLAALCEQLMHASKIGLPTEVGQHIAHIEMEFTRVHAALAHMCHVETTSALTPRDQ